MNFDRPKNWEAVQKMDKRKHFFLVYVFLGFLFLILIWSINLCVKHKNFAAKSQIFECFKKFSALQNDDYLKKTGLEVFCVSIEIPLKTSFRFLKLYN